MRVLTGILFLTYLAVLLNSIDLSTQRVPERPLAPNVLPHPFYYDNHHNIRARGFPNAQPVIRGVYLIGMIDGDSFHAIVDEEEEDRLFMVDLQRHVIIEQTGPQIDARFHGHNVPVRHHG